MRIILQIQGYIMQKERLVSLWKNENLTHIFTSMASDNKVLDEYECMEEAYFRTWLLALAALANECIEDAPDLLHETCPFTSFDNGRLLTLMVNFGDRINPFDDNGHIVNKGLLIVVNALLETIDVSSIPARSRHAAIAYQKKVFFIIDNLLSMNHGVSDIVTDWLNAGVTFLTQDLVDGFSEKLIPYGADINIIRYYAALDALAVDVKQLPVVYLEVLLINDQWPDNRMYDYMSAIERLVKEKYGCTPLQRLRRMDDNEIYLLSLLLRYYCKKKDISPMDYMLKPNVPDPHKQMLLAMV